MVPSRKKIEQELSYLTFLEVDFSFISRNATELPAYLGSTIRGALAQSMRDLVCVRPKLVRCQKCENIDTCVYALIFETARPGWTRNPILGNDVPHPFVLVLKSRGGHFDEGDQLTFSIRLFGSASSRLPFLTEAARRAGRRGLGRMRSPFDVVSGDEGVNRNPLSASNESSFHSSRSLRKIHFSDMNVSNRIQLNLVTPMRILRNHKLVNLPEFRDLIRTLLSRASSLSNLYCGHSTDLDFKALLKAADQVSFASASIERVDLYRYSKRQRRRIPIHGIVGTIDYEGSDLSRFVPILNAGSMIHGGKCTVLGHGMMRVENVR